MDLGLMSDDDFLAENEKDGQGSEDCFLENWAALRARLEGGRLELFAAGCALPPHLWPAVPPRAPPRPKRAGVLPPHLWPAAPPYAPPLRVLPPHLWPAAPPYAPPRPKRFILQLVAVLVQLTLSREIAGDAIAFKRGSDKDVLQYLAVLARLTIQQEIADLIHVDVTSRFTLIVDAGLCTGAACHERVQMLKACMEACSETYCLPSVLPRGVMVDLAFLLSVLFPVLRNFFQDEATEQIKECGFHVKNIEDKRLGAEVMYLRFHQWHRRPNSRPNSKSSKPARRGRGRPDYMRGRPPSCEHCSRCFRGGSLAITCPFDTCGNLHWTCLRPHAEQCHGRLLRNAFRNRRRGRLSTAEMLRRVLQDSHAAELESHLPGDREGPGQDRDQQRIT